MARYLPRSIIASLLISAAALPGAAAAAADAAPSGLGAYLAGRQAERDKRGEIAAQYLADALAGNRDNEKLRNAAFVALVVAGDIEEAARLARDIAGTTDQGPANLVLAAVAAKKGDFKAAQAHIAKLDRGGVNRLMIPIATAWVAAGRKDKAAALAALQTIAFERGFRPFYDLHKALVLDVLGDVPAAKKAYDDALKQTLLPSTRLVMAAASFRTRHGDPEGGLAVLRDFLKNNPEALNIELAAARVEAGRTLPPLVGSAAEGLGEFLSNLAVALQQENFGRQAIFYGRIAQLLRPDDAATLYGLGNILQEDGRHEAAIKVYEQVPKDAFLSWAARQSLAVSLITLKRDEEAGKLMTAMAEERKDQWQILQLMGNMYRARSEFEKALDAYNRAVARVPKITERHWNLLYVRGIANERTKRWPQAEADLKKALSFRPNEPSLLNYLAYSWVERGENLKQAEEMLIRAVKERPDDGFIIDSLGWVLYRLGRFKEAVVYLEKAVAEEPEDPTLNDHLGDCYWRLGREDEARFQWSRALSLKPEKEDIAKIEAKLKNGMEPFKPVISKDTPTAPDPKNDAPKKDAPKDAAPGDGRPAAPAPKDGPRQ